MALVINVAGYTHAFDYKGRMIIIPCDGKVHVVPDDIPNFLELKRVNAQHAPIVAPTNTVAASANVSAPMVRNVSHASLPTVGLGEEIISVELDDELKEVKIYDVFNEKYVKAKNLKSGYDNELNVILAEHLARAYLDAETAEISNEDFDEQDRLEEAAQTHINKKSDKTVTKATTKKRGPKPKPKVEKPIGEPKKRGPKPKYPKPEIDPNAPKRPRGRPPRIAVDVGAVEPVIEVTEPAVTIQEVE